MLLTPDPDSPLQQGDIIQDVPFLVLPKAIGVKAQGVKGQARLDSQKPQSFESVRQHAGENKLTAADVPLVLQLGMVVTQSCDIDYKDFVTLARVFPIGAFIQQAKEAVEANEKLVLFDIARRITEGSDFNHLIYLADPQKSGAQVADLLRVQSYPKEWKACFRQRRVKTLTEDGLKYLQGRLATFTGRYATNEGFWHTEEDRQLAEQVRSDRNAIREAYERLNARKNGGP